MKQEVYKSDFIDAFKKMERYEDFGYNALSALFDFLNSQEKATGVEMMLDVIALCCDYTKYDSIADIASNHRLWFHVDAAYGGFFILTSKKKLFKGIEGKEYYNKYFIIADIQERLHSTHRKIFFKKIK